ncbi:hypothetical protein SEA_XKCD426_26 [Streptomyces phage Xkcd426]|nr:hypothetical protein SEA_XKCD426_26 [Streptomyces phage Xkcd426]
MGQPTKGPHVLIRLKRWLYELLNIASPTGFGWASDVVAGPCAPQPPREYRCAFACCPHPAGLAEEDPEAFRGAQKGTQR